MNRRSFLALLLVAGACALPQPAFAKDDDGGGDDSGGGDSSGGGSDSDDSDNDSDDSSGGQGRGRGRGGDDDEAESDDDKKDDDKQAEKSKKEQDKARDAVKSGKVVPLKKLRSHLATKYPGRLLKVELKQRFGNFVYRVKVLQSGNKLKTITFDAATLQEKWF